MLLATDEVGIQDVTLTPERVWEIIRDRFYGDENVVVQGATKRQILGRLYRTRSKHFGREGFGRLEMEPLCDVKHNPGLKKIQFRLTYYEDEVLHWVIGWAHLKLMNRMKQRQSSLFIDATYRCVPIRFYKLVIVMVYDPISDLYLPFWYALTSGKTTRVYELLFNYICVATKTRLDPAHVVCDFEYAMIKTVKV
ncbi:hypothetical protein P3T76_008517 [Phytophthora citrophthora]|uniref:MULE transposase domain-containing protein n=1 Tax=Phytophthora citrophthora TaxID=4793 RepID=A0AAD9LM63_9STRA|nr:hypothetical protein P3T76_008517 [Phytophthora citrophthora]